MLALANLLTKQEILCRIYVKFDQSWVVTTLQNMADIEKLRYALTEYSYLQSHDPLPDLSGERASGMVVFTAEPAAIMLESDTFSESEKWHIQETNGEIIFNRS